MRDPESTKHILERRKNGQHPLEFEENGLRAIYKLFWADMPHADIFMAFTPNLLHQIHKGVFKDHLEVDAWFKVIPDYPGLRHFKKGILTVKQWTGSMCETSMGDVLQIHTAELLEGLQTALAGFHANKDILKELAIHEHFNIPKLDQLTHYHLHIDFAKEAYRASNK
ncbi:hypothetical protein BDR03DRAFT_930994 [Suillus americanus]|nr:hypothetical protein BDR03DRAFT_930994 [Suillus americanus]